LIVAIQTLVITTEAVQKHTMVSSVSVPRVSKEDYAKVSKNIFYKMHQKFVCITPFRFSIFLFRHTTLERRFNGLCRLFSNQPNLQ